MPSTHNKFQNKYRISSARAEWHDYNGGAYFITICTAGREHYFGEIANCTDAINCVSTVGKPQMILSEIGKYTNECIGKIESLHNNVFVPLYVIMPNHIHLIVIVDDVVETRQCHVSTDEQQRQCHISTNEQADGKNIKMQEIGRTCKFPWIA